MTEAVTDTTPGPAAAHAPASRWSALWRRLQFSGWLQFALPFALALGLGLLALVLRVFGLGTVGVVVAVLAGLVLGLGLFEVALLKLRLFALSDRDHRPVPGDVFAVMAARRSVRSFQPLALAPSDLAAVRSLLSQHTSIDAAHALVQGEVRAEFVEQRITVWPGIGAQSFIVIVVPARYDRMAVIEAGRALEHVVLGLTARGVGTCWIGPGTDRRSAEAALGSRFDPTRDHVLATIAVGYESRWKPLLARVMRLWGSRRKPLADLVYDSAPGLPAPLHHKALKPLRPLFDACRRAPSSYNGQTTRIILREDAEGLASVKFCATEGSRFYAPLALGISFAHWEAGMRAIGRPGQVQLWQPPAPMAGGLVHDLTWRPLRGAATTAGRNGQTPGNGTRS
ncbi:nitroreductase family protein [Maritimibacter sp. DP1N21-5]|uniref:nitroreductase family protein n=1 Tax=Maritimibacter sp. DP1N21-5 TaxID=2836867 RepID=UPI001C46537D|nr:nitroreductase family protein [Maritimibacter sp. DP1N21-5]MBV7410440.1 hypothetical protein [Maritimibacter sp. DP1N21-5]